jgi:cytochrome c
MAGGELNKWLMAILAAVLVAMLAGFVSRQLIHPHHLEKTAYAVPVEEAAPAAAPAAESEELEPIAPLLAAANAENGAKIARACTACHSFEQGGANKVGPNLWEVVGRKLASHEGFSYSKALTDKGGTWDYEALNHFLVKPQSFAPGTKMTFAGLKKAEQRADVIAYLRDQAATKQPLPAAQ